MAAFFNVHDVDQLTIDARRRTRRRMAVIAVSTIVLVSVVIAAVVGTAAHKRKEEQSTGLSSSIKAVCDVTLHPELCYERLGSQAGGKTSPQDLFSLSIEIALTELQQASGKVKTGLTQSNDSMANAAMATCQELIEMSMDHLNSSLLVPITSLTQAFDDLRTWLSTSGTCLETCLDGFIDVDENIRTELTGVLQNSTQLTSNSLAIVSWISTVTDSVKFGQRRLLTDGGLPVWVQRVERHLLESPALRLKADLVVAKDGSGKFKTISDALKAVPSKSTKTTIIYVKKGVYTETVVIDKSKWNVLFVGDGMDATIVSGNKNVVDGTATFDTAPFAVAGKGLVAKDMGFRNTAGAAKHQAVAMRSSGDFSVFHRCKFDAFQDTLYPHANRQFYRDCLIIGTVDFIFGNSAAVFQNCNIQPRLPMSGQKNTITAQGKSDPNQNTGLSFQNCTITPFNNLGSTQTYLGRPWKNYSTTLFINSFLGSLINPKGWLPWTGSSAPSTIFYGEFQNSGPGSSTKNRVNWKGLRTITAAIAKKFTVDSFIAGSKWITAAGVPFKGGL